MNNQPEGQQELRDHILLYDISFPVDFVRPSRQDSQHLPTRPPQVRPMNVNPLPTVIMTSSSTPTAAGPTKAELHNVKTANTEVRAPKDYHTGQAKMSAHASPTTGMQAASNDFPGGAPARVNRAGASRTYAAVLTDAKAAPGNPRSASLTTADQSTQCQHQPLKTFPSGQWVVVLENVPNSCTVDKLINAIKEMGRTGRIFNIVIECAGPRADDRTDATTARVAFFDHAGANELLRLVSQGRLWIDSHQLSARGSMTKLSEVTSPELASRVLLLHGPEDVVTEECIYTWLGVGIAEGNLLGLIDAVDVTPCGTRKLGRRMVRLEFAGFQTGAQAVLQYLLDQRGRTGCAWAGVLVLFADDPCDYVLA
ncbi:Uu.00g012630.m01.CDS01 [Anthostomella pinea]|uniref:Uu.00g012630.m01.CDS01 n=1 Tax=Anthostomella pinea TaxID=933095 RepID=A0AAI8YQ40_9PEZI|nr:Uu.00g012630.m01.CDS01 [Anthostomella pinea]